jgi:ech hydrogenase subunit F
VESCPKKCLSMKQTYTQPDAEKKTDTFVKPEQPAPAAQPAKPAADAAKQA